ncbi:hypothetical protein [Lentibacillus amyloliquefaciens]|nr:hypothetical protein [Lentibacillus amyloliquefaciens]
MWSFTEMRENTERKLGRGLHENELAFLQWVYERYAQEQKKMNTTH